MKWINFVNRITMCNLKASSHVPSQPPPPPPPPYPCPWIGLFQNTIILFVVPPKLCINIVFSFSWDLQSPQEKLKTILMRNLMDKNKHYGIEKKRLWNRLFPFFPGLCIKTRLSAWPLTGKWFFILMQTRTFLVTLSLAWSPCGLEIRFVVRGAGAVMPRFRF